MPRGEATLGPLRVAWEVPDDFPEATGGLEHLPLLEGGRGVRWVVRHGEPGPRPARFDAFYGPVLLELGDPSRARVWSPGAELFVTNGEVEGVVNGLVALPSTIALHALAAHAGLAHQHAALVSLDGKNVLAPGGSGAGKSSLALAVAKNGGVLRSDDQVYVGRDLVAFGVRRPPHVTETTRAAHPELPVLGPVVEGVLSKVRLEIVHTEPARPVAVDAILLARLDPDGPTRVVPVEGAEAFAALLGSSALVMPPGSPRREEMLDILAALAELPTACLFAGRDAFERPELIPLAIRRWLAQSI